MRKQKRKFNRVKVIGIIAVIISLVMVFGSMILLELEKISPPIAIVLLAFGMIGIFLSTFVIFIPDTKNN